MHWIVDGNSFCMSDCGQEEECVHDRATDGEAANKRGTAIAVQCCALDGSEAFRKELGCLKAVNFEVASTACEDHGYRLCTRQEVHSRIGDGQGCMFNGYSVWTKTECSKSSVAPQTSSQTSSVSVLGAASIVACAMVVLAAIVCLAWFGRCCRGNKLYAKVEEESSMSLSDKLCATEEEENDAFNYGDEEL